MFNPSYPQGSNKNEEIKYYKKNKKKRKERKKK